MKILAVPFVVVILAITFLTLPSAEAGKSSVDIINYSTGWPLRVHCKSKDNDLQWQLLQINQDYHFEFHHNIFDTTVFWCRFVWGPGDKYWQAFTVWDQYHDMPLRCGNCLWRAQSDGMYIWDKANHKYDFWKSWNTNGPTTFANETNPPTGSWRPALNANQGGDN